MFIRLCSIFILLIQISCVGNNLKTKLLQSSPIKINASSIIPIINNSAIPIYVHNYSSETVSNISYYLEYTLNSKLTTTSIDNQCTQIKANSSCQLQIIPPNLISNKGQENSVLLKASTTNFETNRIINFKKITNNTPGVYFSDPQQIIIANEYNTFYLYGGANHTYQINNFAQYKTDSQLKPEQVLAIEINPTTNQQQLSISALDLVTKKSYQANLNLSIQPISNRPLLTSGILNPILVNASNTPFSLLIVNAGNQATGALTLTYPVGISPSTGSTECNLALGLAANNACYLYFTINNVDSGSGVIELKNTSLTTSAIEAVNWYSSPSSILIQMSANPSITTFLIGKSTNTLITLTNNSIYPLTGIISSFKIGGSATGSISNNTCDNLAAGASCGFSFTASDTIPESNNILFTIIGSYNDGNSQTYSRIMNLAYEALLPPWIWMSGNNTINSQGVYGTQGEPLISNYPGARESSISWTDSTNNLWLFGGQGYDTNANSGYLNDLWKYNPNDNTWTWISGSNTSGAITGNYGKQGVPSITNYPGSRNNSISWIDSNNNLWLLGGQGYGKSTQVGYLNDLWQYNPQDNTWTWQAGKNTINAKGVYGEKGIPKKTNYPGARDKSLSWVDSNKNIWIFGGRGQASTNSSGNLNDLWKYNPSNNTWTWINGLNSINNPGVYGTKAIPASNNYPGSRFGASSWIDTNNNLWLFGGQGYDINNSLGYLNDLWKYNPNDNTWTWISGANSINQPGVYGTQAIPSSNNIPGARSNAISWVDPQGNFWLFGGVGYASASSIGVLNDLWKYNPNDNTWMWQTGSNIINQTGIYGTKGISDSNNYSGARSSSISFVDSTGNIWFFGGYGYNASSPGYLNDLWQWNTAIWW